MSKCIIAALWLTFRFKSNVFNLTFFTKNKRQFSMRELRPKANFTEILLDWFVDFPLISSIYHSHKTVRMKICIPSLNISDKEYRRWNSDSDSTFVWSLICH